MLSVACDICGRRYSLGEDRWEQRITCKVCGTVFEVCEFNEIDPDLPEFSEDDDSDEEPSMFSTMQSVCVNVLGCVCVVITLSWMIGLLFRDPRQLMANNSPETRPTARQNQAPSPEVERVQPAANPFQQPRPEPNFSGSETTNRIHSGSTPPLPSVAVPTPPVQSPPPDKNPPSVASTPVEAETNPFETVEEVNPFETVEDAQTKPARPNGQPVVPQSQVPKSNRSTRPRSTEQKKIGGVNYNGPHSIPSSGRTITSTNALRVGQVIQVKEGSIWFPADVLAIHANGTVRIHYRGWSETWDLDVPLTLIQLAHE